MPFPPESKAAQWHRCHQSTKSAGCNKAFPGQILLRLPNSFQAADSGIPLSVSPVIHKQPIHICGKVRPDFLFPNIHFPNPSADDSCPISHIQCLHCEGFFPLHCRRIPAPPASLDRAQIDFGTCREFVRLLQWPNPDVPDTVRNPEKSSPVQTRYRISDRFCLPHLPDISIRLAASFHLLSSPPGLYCHHCDNRTNRHP